MPLGSYDFWRGEYSLVRPVPVPLDREIAQFCRSWSKKDDQSRATLSQRLSADELGTLFLFARRAAVLALRNHGSDWLGAGFTAVALLDVARFDFRDILHLLELLIYAAKRIGSDADALLKAAARLSSAATGETINKFLKRLSRVKKIRDTWYGEVEIDGQVGIVDWAFKRYLPKCDFERIVVEIADRIDRDTYQVRTISIAAEIPDLWLLTGNAVVDAPVREALKKARAAASVVSEMRPRRRGSYKSQRLRAFLAEMRTQAAAGLLLAQSEQIRAEDFHVLGLAEGKLFCLLLSASDWFRGLPAETFETLGRFAVDISQILASARPRQT